MAVKTFVTGEVLTASDTNTYLANSGLVHVKSQTVGSGVSSVTVSDCFNSTYDVYRVVVNAVDCSAADVVIRMTLGATAGGYYGNMKYYKIGVGNGDLPLSNDAYWYVGITDGEDNTCFSFDVFAPNLAKRTAYAGLGWGYLSTFWTSGMLANTTQYTAFTLTPQAGTMTGGTIAVYGYRKG